MKVKCPKCGIENLNIDSFCHSCGAELSSVIKRCECGSLMEPHYIFCVYCGKEVKR